MASILTRRRVIWTGAIVGITATGAIFGAQMKDDREVVQKTREEKEMSAADQIALLESRKRMLVKQRDDLQKKLAGLENKERIQEEQAQEKA